MAYKKVSGAQSAEIELDGSVCTVNFGNSYKYYAVRNDSSETIYVSTTDKSCTPKNDGVVSIPSGGSYVHCNGYGGNSEIYLNGSGGAVVIAQDDANNPFRKAQKGGGGNAGSNILLHSEGLAAYFDWQKNVSENEWSDIVGGLSLEGDFVPSDGSVICSNSTDVPILLKDCYTVYIIFKNSNAYPLDYWSGIFVNYKNIFGIYDNLGKIGVYDNYSQNQYISNITTTNYHICTITFDNGFGSLYIDGNLKYTKSNNALPDTFHFITTIGAYKMIGVCNNVVHGSDYIFENTQYLAEQYGIEI